MSILTVYLFLFNIILIIGSVWSLVEQKLDLGLTSYLVLIYVLLGGLAGRLLINQEFSTIKFKKIDHQLLWILLVSLTLGVVDILTEHSAKSIWLDEYTQRLVMRSGSLIWAATHSQQMPTDYVLTWINLKIFGMTEFSVRSWAGLSYLSCIGFIFYFSWRIFKSKIAVIFSLALFFGIALLREYAVEARPTHLAVLWSLIYCYTIFNWLTNRSHCATTLFVVTSSFLLTAGLQPLFVVGSVCVAVLLFYRGGGALRKFLQLNALSGVLMIPFIVRIYVESVPLSQFHGSEIKGFLKYFTEFLFVDTYPVYFDAFGIQFLFLLFCSGLTGLLLKKESFKLKPVVFWMATFLAFVVSYDLFFAVKVNWPNYQRYFIAVAPFFILAGGSLVQTLRSVGGHVGRDLSLAFLCVAVFGASYTRYLKTDYFSTSVRTQYRYLDKYGKKGDYALQFNLGHSWQWFPDIWIAREIYTHDWQGPHLLMRMSRASELDFEFAEFDIVHVPRKAFSRGKPFRIFLVTEYTGLYEYWKIWKKKGLKFKITKLAWETVGIEIEIPAEGGLEFFKSYIWAIIDELEEQPEKTMLGRMFDTLIFYAYMEKDLKAVKQLFERQLKIDYFENQSPSHFNKIESYVKARQKKYKELEQKSYL